MIVIWSTNSFGQEPWQTAYASMSIIENLSEPGAAPVIGVASSLNRIAGEITQITVVT